MHFKPLYLVNSFSVEREREREGERERERGREREGGRERGGEGGRGRYAQLILSLLW